MNMRTKNRDSVVDSLFSSEDTEIEGDELEVYFPKKCRQCHNAIICNILPATVTFSRMGIKINIEECPFCNPIKNV